MEHLTMATIYTCHECCDYRELHVDRERVITANDEFGGLDRIEGFIEGLLWCGNNVEVHNKWIICKECEKHQDETED